MQHHVVAWIQKGKTPIYAVNGMETSPRYYRRYSGGDSWCAHAEMKAIHLAGDVKGHDLYVIRYQKSGVIGNARPCEHCQHHIKRAGIRNVYYTDETGTWRKEKASSFTGKASRPILLPKNARTKWVGQGTLWRNSV